MNDGQRMSIVQMHGFIILGKPKRMRGEKLCMYVVVVVVVAVADAA